jgi:hypothetical protein
MAINFTQLIEYFIESYKDSKKQKDLIEQIKELLVQELRWNLELLNEIKSLQKTENQELVFKLIDKIEIDVFNLLRESGIPLGRIVEGTYTPNMQATYQYRLSLLGTKTRLIYRVYHRLKVNKLRVEIQNERGERSLKYLFELLRESIRILEE